MSYLPQEYARLGIATTEHPALDLAVARARAFKEQHPGAGTFLEYGCGPGRLTGFWARSLDVDVTGVDTSAECLNYARFEHPRHRFVRPGTLKQEKFPIAVAAFVHMENHNEEDMLTVDNRVFKHLKPSGLYLIVAPNPDSIGMTYNGWSTELVSDEGNRKLVRGVRFGNPDVEFEDAFWSVDSHLKSLETAGFDEEDIGVEFPPLSEERVYGGDEGVPPLMVIYARK